MWIAPIQQFNILLCLYIKTRSQEKQILSMIELWTHLTQLVLTFWNTTSLAYSSGHLKFQKLTMLFMLMMNCYCEMIYGQRYIAVTYISNPIITSYHCKLWSCYKQDLNLYRNTVLSLLMKLSISDNHYTTVPQKNWRK